MKKIELRLVGLSYSATEGGSYVLFLGERKGNTKLPIIIKPNDAQYIGMKMEGLTVTRPLTHDLFKKITDALGADLQEIYIKHVIEGIFYVKLLFSNMMEEFEIDSSVGDAISMAMSYKCPIFCSSEVLKISGIQMDDDGTITEDIDGKERDYSGVITVENLEKMKEKALDNEEYEIASQLRDRINELKEKENSKDNG